MNANEGRAMPVGQPRVILIEDHPLVRAGQRMLLEHEGYVVAEITAGADLERFTPIAGVSQAILADYDLGPGMSGVDVALAVMRRTGERIPTLVLSASLGARSLAQAAAHEMAVMFKPAREEKVLAWVAGAVGRQTPP
jgi:CheY-like chemotaxis protein